MVNSNPAHGKSNAKIILIGEHAVVYGQPAIALPLTTVNVKATVEDAETESTINSSYFTGKLADFPVSGIKHLINYLIDKNEIENPLSITIKSDLPAERGMGSSAAVAVALIRAFYTYLGKPLTKTQLLNLANISEKDTHKNPSGLDAATCASEQPIWMVRNQELKTFPIKTHGYLVIADSGIKGKTSQAIAVVKEWLMHNPDETQKLISDLGQLAFNAKDALASDDIEKLGEIFNAAQAILRQLGVSCAQLDDLIALSLKNGSLGSKLTGGGKGGCFICLTKSIGDASGLSQALLDAGATQTWIEPLLKEAVHE